MVKLLVREEWKHIGSTREAFPNEGIICKVEGRKMTGGIVKEFCNYSSRRNMGEFVAQKGRTKRITFALVDW